MKRAAASFALAALLATPVLAKPKQEPGRAYTNPSDIVAAEIAFNRLAREKGQWTAFLETAADDAVMFVPQKVLAKDWLKNQVNPPKAVQWQPQRVYISCNGRTAASTGTWQRPDGAQGYFTTIWRLGDKGEWKWALDHGDALKTPLPQKEFTEGHVATCKPEEKQRSADGAPPADESLLWDYAVHDDGSREVRMRVWNGEDYDLVIDDKVAANP